MRYVVDFVFCMDEDCSVTMSVVTKPENIDFEKLRRHAEETLRAGGFKPKKMLKAVVAEPKMLCVDEDFYYDPFCENYIDGDEDEE